MNKLSDKELIYKSYNNYYYGFLFPKQPTLLELNILYNQILDSKFSNKIKRKLLSRVKYQIRYSILSSDDLINNLREEFQFNLN